MIAFNSQYRADLSGYVRSRKVKVTLTENVVEELKDYLLNIDLRKLGKTHGELINKDIDFLESVDLGKHKEKKIDVSPKIIDDNLVLSPLSYFSLHGLGGHKFIKFDIRDILEALAFKHLHYEFNCDIPSIEKAFKDTHPMARNDSSILMDLVGQYIDNLAMLKDFEIGDKSYLGYADNTMYDFFGNKFTIHELNYNAVLMSTFKIATLVSIVDLSDFLSEYGVNYLPVGYIGTEVYFMVDEYPSLDCQFNLIVEVFDRRFRFKKDYSIVEKGV